MQIYKINKNNFKQFLKDSISTDIIGANIISKKASYHTIFIKNLPVGGANILKQDALSIGADVAVPKGTILAQTKYVDVVLVGSTKHFEILAKKELSQPFGLKTLAKQLKNFTSNLKKQIDIMGIINANNDSFYSNSRYKDTEAIKQIKQMIKDGANIIDIGAVSSKPKSVIVDEDEELKRIKFICDTIKKEKLYKKVIFSIDSYTPSVVKYALKSGFGMVNDITGLSDKKIAKLVAKYNATIVIMHMQGVPSTMQDNPTYDDVIVEVENFFKKRIKKAKKYGIKKIILDVGIGFGKTLDHNLDLLQNLAHFNHFGYPILVGASRKSMINEIVPSDIKDRLSGTLTIHLDAIQKGANIIRCHDVKEHHQAIKVLDSIRYKK